ncbi:MAG: alpha/beta hydrolase fold domain-containing protein [Bacteroidetes bacterium]|nr:alpha/beta hydrolase fold domain-containing protein [Bacteroidota bacterium]
MKLRIQKSSLAAIILLALNLCTKPIFAQSKADDQLINGYTILKDVSYGSDSEQIMDVYLSKATSERKENYTIVFMHGGGYYYSDKSKEERYIQPYLDKGFNVVNLNYRLKRGIAIATEDLTIALNYLHENNSKFNLDLKKIVTTGFSAGAHIATIVGVSQNNKEYPNRLDKSIEIIAIVNFSGPVDGLDVIEQIFTEHEMEAARVLGIALFPDIKEYATKETVSVLEPITYLDKKDPPLFIWHGGQDDQVPPKTFETFVSRLNKNPDKNIVVFDTEAGHSPTNESLANTYKKVFDFIDGL